MNIHNFRDEDLRMLAGLAIDLCTDHLYFKVFKKFSPKENYWSYDCRFTHSMDCFDTYYDSFFVNSGRDNKPETYQMGWAIKKNEKFEIRPITSPLLVVHYFEEMCKKSNVAKN
jgi:hypothetical protein